jgi:hypothetical protein
LQRCHVNFWCCCCSVVAKEIASEGEECRRWGIAVGGAVRVREGISVGWGGKWWAVDERERGQCLARERSLFLQREGLLCFFILKDEQGATASLLERIWLGFFCVSLNFCLFLCSPCEFVFSSWCLWLEVHLYRKSLHVLLKKIL